jgi:mannose-1-phosphate guanylyltransferase/phosphomannomutase
MNAIVLAGGKGTRLAPLTTLVPKPMLTVAGYPMLDYVTSQLYYYGIKNIVYAVAYKKEQIQARADGYKGITARYSCDDIPLGTAGSVKKAIDMLDDTFVVISGDCLNDINLSAMLKKHKASGAQVTMAVVEREETTKYGVVQIDKNDRITSIIEKPQTNDFGNIINAGVYIVNKRIFSNTSDGMLDFAKDVFPVLVQNNQIGAYFHKGLWTDIGAIDDYYLANFYMKEREFYPMIKSKNSEKYDNNDGNIISSSAKVFGKTINSIINDNATVASGVKIRNSIILPKSTVESNCTNCIVGQDFIFKLSSQA